MQTDKIISPCGVICSDCEYYPAECSGCPSIEGHVFWLEHTGDKCCPIYQCCITEKELPHCGHCPAMPCKHYEQEDPTRSHEDNMEIFQRQVALLDELRQLPGTEQPKHLFSENALWKTKSEFTDAEGNVSKGIGESLIELKNGLISNTSWALVGGDLMENNYTIVSHSPTRFKSVSDNPALGIQEGVMDVAGPRIYSKFFIRETELNGYEIMTREGSICHARGALYNGDDLINCWSAKMTKQ